MWGELPVGHDVRIYSSVLVPGPQMAEHRLESPPRVSRRSSVEGALPPELLPGKGECRGEDVHRGWYPVGGSIEFVELVPGELRASGSSG